MVRPLWLLNILLTTVAIGLAVALARSIVSSVAISNRPTAEPGARVPSPAKAPDSNAPSQLSVRRRSLAEYDSILRGSLFTDPEEEARQKQAARPLPPPPPLPLLQGTIFIGNEAKAILKEGNREELYDIGDRVAGGTLSQIDVDRVVIDFGNRRAEVMLKTAVRRLPSPPPEIALDSKRASRTKAASAPPVQNPQTGTEAQVQGQPIIESIRMQRARRILERRQQMREAQK